MRILKFLIISFIVVFLIFTVISFFIPADIRISKQVMLREPPVKIWEPIDDLGKWKEWNPFFSGIAPQKFEYFDTGIGHVTAMKVDDVIVSWDQIKADEHIAEIRKEKGRAVLNGWKLLYDRNDTTILQWYMDFHLRWYPWEKFSSILFEKRYGPLMEEGLNNLKNYLEDDHSSNK